MLCVTVLADSVKAGAAACVRRGARHSLRRCAVPPRHYTGPSKLMLKQSSEHGRHRCRVRGYLVGLQARITDALEAVEGEGGARFPGRCLEQTARRAAAGAMASPKSWKVAGCLSARAVASAMCVAHSCRLGHAAPA